MAGVKTIPDSKDVTTDWVDTWAIDFGPAIQSGETIVDKSAVLVTAMPANDGTVVAGFVTGTAIAGSKVNVSWNGSVLEKFATYRLETKATLNTGAVVELLTTVKCVA